MPNRKGITLLIGVLLLVLICQNINAQLACGSDELHRKLMLTDSAYKSHYNLLLTNVRNKIQQNHNQNPNRPQGAPAIYTIPVVVHVIHLGEPVGTGTNISVAQIQSAISGLNDRFKNTIGAGLEIGIEFCLASRDPYGCPTTGINRVNGSGVANYTTIGIDDDCGGANEDSIKMLSRWPVSDYYNIWVVNNICNGQWAGYAYYPWGGVNDGAVMAYNYMTYASSTLTHEIGHGFNLPHTFSGDGGNTSCPVDTSCSINGDYLCDTPPHKQNDCGTTNPCTALGTWDNSRYNYMSYCHPVQAIGRFTSDGRSRMLATMQVSPRASLATSLGCVRHFNATITKTNLLCTATCNGSATATPSCGTSPFTYIWSSGATTQTATNLCAGAYNVTITDATGITVSLTTTISATPDVPAGVTSNSPQCDTVLISQTGTPTTGETWYWQGTSCDSTLALGAASTYKVTASGTYYLRAYNNTGHCWSTSCASVTVVVTTTPPNPTSNAPLCTTTTLTRAGTPQSGETWYWQGTTCGTLTSQGFSATKSVTASGTYYIRARNNNTGCWSKACGSITIQIDTFSNTVTTPANPTSNSPQCSSVTITRTGAPTTGYSWYWQGTDCGTNTSLGSSTTYSATASGTYYIRARNTTTGCWSTDCGSIIVTTGTIATPANPTSNSPRCSSVTLTRTGSPPSGQTWYWQGNSCGTSTSLGSSTTYAATSSGTYYIRSFSIIGGCWSTSCGSITVEVDTVSASVVTPGNPTSNSPQCNNVTVTRNGSPPAGHAWYWQGLNCGISTALGSSTTSNASTSGTYYIRARNTTTGCWSPDCGSVAIVVNSASVAPTGIALSNNPACYGDSVALTVSGGLLGAGAQWKWYQTSCGVGPIGTGAVLSGPASVSLTAYVRAEGLCNTTTCASTTLTVNSALIVNAGISSSICIGESITLGGSPTTSGGTSPYNYNWLPNTNLDNSAIANPLASPSNTTTYTLQVTDNSNCSQSATITVTVPITNGGTGNWTWQGTVSTDWFNPCNWDKKNLPDVQSDVIIPGGTLFQPTINTGSANCNTITVNQDAGAIITVNSDNGAVLNIAQ